MLERLGFADTSLPYKDFLRNQYEQDGIQVKWKMSPENLSVEWAAELGRGLGFPVAEESNGIAGALYARVGGNAGISNRWRAGLSYLGANPKSAAMKTPMHWACRHAIVSAARAASGSPILFGNGCLTAIPL